MIPAHTSIDPNAGPKIVSAYHFTTRAAPSLRVATPNGHISVHGGTGNAVVVTVTRRASSPALMKQIAVSVVQKGGDIDAGASIPRGCTSCTAFFDVSVPSASNVAVVSQLGSITVQNISGRLTAAATKGSVLCGGLSGDATLTTGAGMLNAGFANITHVRRVTLAAGTGSVRVVFPANAATGSVKGSSGLGAAVEQQAGPHGPMLDLATGNGNIVILKAP